MTLPPRLTLCTAVLLAFAAGSLVTNRLSHLNQVKADSNRVFELRVYHTLPGKAPALEARFRDKTAALLAKHDLNVIGYWVPNDPPASENTFLYIVAHRSLEDAKKNWAALRADPDFAEIVKSEQADKLVERVDSTYMHPTDFSPMK